MVASNIILPNIRRFLVPDPGYLIVDVDLSGADAQVVAWEADDDDLKAAFRSGVKIHLKNARDMFQDETVGKTDEEIKASPIYDTSKTTLHALNYYGTPKGVAPRVKLTVREVENFQRKWFGLHPGIPQWHDRTLRHLEGTECWSCRTPAIIVERRCSTCGVAMGRTIRNAFGYRRIYFDRVGDPMLREALAWVPQSTVAIVTQRGLLLLEDTYEFIQMLLQVHDSLTFQIPKGEESVLPEIRTTLNSITVPYPDPLNIQWGLKWSDQSWGDCE